MEFLRRFREHVLPAGFHRVRSFGWFHPAARVALNRVRALVFEFGQKKMTRKEATQQLREITGCGQSACYSALRPDGKFKDHLREENGLLSWVYPPAAELPLGSSDTTGGPIPVPQ